MIAETEKWRLTVDWALQHATITARLRVEKGPLGFWRVVKA